MARILDKILPASASRMIKLRQSYDWLKAERDAISERYEEKKQKEKLLKKRQLNTKKITPCEIFARCLFFLRDSSLRSE